MAEVELGTVFNAALFGKLMTGGWYEHAQLKEQGLKILSRDKFTCQSCGFSSRPSRQAPHGYMVPVDRHHVGMVATRADAGECLCPLCASAMGINWAVVATAIGGKHIDPPGMLIIQPSMTQVEINRIALHTLSIVASNSATTASALASAARDIDAAMTALNQDIGASIPFYRGKDSDFARALALLPEAHYEQRDEIIGHLRWWPSMRYWREQGVYWMQATYKPLQDKDQALSEVLAG